MLEYVPQLVNNQPIGDANKHLEVALGNKERMYEGNSLEFFFFQ